MPLFARSIAAAAAASQPTVYRQALQCSCLADRPVMRRCILRLAARSFSVNRRRLSRPSPFKFQPPESSKAAQPRGSEQAAPRTAAAASTVNTRRVPVSVASLAASRKAAFSPPSSSPSSAASAAASPTPAANAEQILSVLADLDRPLPLRTLERMVYTLLALPPSVLTLTSAQYLTILQALTRRELQCKADLPQYLSMAGSLSPASSPYHPQHQDHAIMASLTSASQRRDLRRSLFLLSLAIRCDVVLLGMTPEQRLRLPSSLLLLCHRILLHAGHRYMAERARKAYERSSEADSQPDTAQQLLQPTACLEALTAEQRNSWPYLLKREEEMRDMQSDDAAALARELEELSSGRTAGGEEEHRRLLIASLVGAEGVSEAEVDGLQEALRLCAKKLEVNAESERDRVLRWRVMLLVEAVQRQMRRRQVRLSPVLRDELLRVFANCAAVQPAMQLVASVPPSPSFPDLLTFQYLFRTCSLMQRWEQPHAVAAELVSRMQARQLPLDLHCYNDLLRCLDRSEQWEQVLPTVRLMRQQGVEGNDVTWQYVNQSLVSAGEDRTSWRQLLLELGGEQELREVRQEMEREQQLVDSMDAHDFFPALNDDSERRTAAGGAAGAGQGEAAPAAALSDDERAALTQEAERLKQKLRQELSEELDIVGQQSQG